MRPDGQFYDGVLNSRGEDHAMADVAFDYNSDYMLAHGINVPGGVTTIWYNTDGFTGDTSYDLVGFDYNHDFMPEYLYWDQNHDLLPDF